MSPMTRLSACLLLVAACQSSEDRGDSRTFAEDAASFVPPDGWDVRRDRETLVLVGGAHGPAARTTIALRSALILDWSEPRNLDNVTASTGQVLRALPGAVVRGPVEVEHPIYRARAFDVTWTPAGQGGRRYQRRHVTVEASEHIYHLVLTGPEGRLDASKDVFARVLDTLREEG